MKFEFSVPGEVVGQGRPRATTVGGHVRMYDPEKSRDYKSKVALFAQAQMKEQGLTGLQVPSERGFRVSISADAPVPKSFSKKKQMDAVCLRIRPTKRPDCDNVIKAVLDALNGVFWEDDRLVTTIFMTKYYSPEPELKVSIEWVGEGEVDEP